MSGIEPCRVFSCLRKDQRDLNTNMSAMIRSILVDIAFILSHLQ